MGCDVLVAYPIIGILFYCRDCFVGGSDITSKDDVETLS
jgi:hypothetical protein